jgi:hypothetical protein
MPAFGIVLGGVIRMYDPFISVEESDAIMAEVGW